ncbi:serine hydrolase domain-containing protein [Microvirga pakistanensis]|uniref:serine hydrolase domain-containing protein n=1 Tax=Microvirga pakistanensis TaxID=1682650 RepID=UPI00106DC8F8|nr:serine hydrolase domain-containing protein [Microvirga pakistanensis]
MAETWAVVRDGVVEESHDADRLVPWWSFTKTVLAAAALVLVRDGLLNLDEPIPDRPYTLRHLLQHRSGLAEYGWFPAYHEAVARRDEPWSVPDLLACVDADRLRYPPGEGWEYSNIGYLFVRRMIETVTGEGLDDALRRLVLRPLEVTGARVATLPVDLEQVTMGSASSYHPAWVYHGLLVGGVQDAARLLHGLMRGELLPAGMVRAMLTPFVLPGPVEGRPWTRPGYGLGVMTGETACGLVVAGHTGGGPGSTIAVYHALEGQVPSRTAACFMTDEDQSRTEERTFTLLKG